MSSDPSTVNGKRAPDSSQLFKKKHRRSSKVGLDTKALNVILYSPKLK